MIWPEVSGVDPFGISGSLRSVSGELPCVEGVLWRGDNSGHALSRNTDEVSVFSNHDTGDAPPSPEVREHAISNSHRFDGSVSVFGEHHCPRGEARYPSCHNVDCSPFIAPYLSQVVQPQRIGPVLRQYAPTPRINLYMSNDLPPHPLSGQTEPTDPRAKLNKPHHSGTIFGTIVPTKGRRKWSGRSSPTQTRTLLRLAFRREKANEPSPVRMG
jgi:hypothetical protein